jgi:hypothetical protein
MRGLNVARNGGTDRVAQAKANLEHAMKLLHEAMYIMPSSKDAAEQLVFAYGQIKFFHGQLVGLGVYESLDSHDMAELESAELDLARAIMKSEGVKANGRRR